MSLTSELLVSGLPIDSHAALGYRTVTAEEAYALVGYKLSGWVVPFNNPQGKPYLCSNGKPFHRFKPDPGQMQGDNPPRYLSPKGEGCRPYISPLLTEAQITGSKPINVTEGEKKTDALNHFGFPTVGLAGVDAWLTDQKPIPQLNDINWEGREVRVIFDSDVTVKPSVRHSLARFCLWLHEQGAHPRVVLLPCEPDGYKNGADDFLLRHGAQNLQHLIRIARPCILLDKDDEPRFVWSTEPKEPHHKAITATTAFNGTYSHRQGHGLYRWSGKHWEAMPGRGAHPINKPLHQWMDEMDWHKRSSSLMGSVRQELIARLDQHGWNPSDRIAFSNGTLRGDTFTLGHDRADLQTLCLPFPYDAGAKCPHWHQFLQQSFGEDDLIRLLRAAFKWSLKPKDVDQPFPIEHAFDCYGPRRSGKGTLSEALQTVCGGSRGVGLIKSSSFSNPNALHALIGKRVAIDPDASGRISDPGVFNNICSNEPVEVKKLYENNTSARLGVVPWRFFNDAPGASGGGQEGMGRRIITFRFENPVTNPDIHLKQKLIDEAAGIFFWAWSMPDAEMFDALRNHGKVRQSREASVETALEREPILQFLLEEFEEGISHITSSDLYQRWAQWCSREGHAAGSSTRFGREVKKVTGLVTAGRSNTARHYSINPTRDFDLAAHLGITLGSDNSIPSQLPTCHANPSPQEPCGEPPHLTVVTGVTSSSLKNREERKNKYIGHIESKETLVAVQPVTPVTPVTPTPRPCYVDGSNGWTCPSGVLRGDSVVLIDPDGRTRNIKTKRVSWGPSNPADDQQSKIAW